MEKEISSGATFFLKYWLVFIVLSIFILYFIFGRFRSPVHLSKQIIVVFGVFVTGYCLVTMINIKRVFLRDSSITIDNFKTTTEISLKNVVDVWQTYGFLTRIIKVRYKTQTGDLATFKFIAKLEVDMTADHHSIITELKEKIEAISDTERNSSV